MIYTVEHPDINEVLIFSDPADAEEMCMALCEDLLYTVAGNSAMSTSNVSFATPTKTTATVTNPKTVAELAWKYASLIPLAKINGYVVKAIPDNFIMRVKGYDLGDATPIYPNIAATAELEDARGQD